MKEASAPPPSQSRSAPSQPASQSATQHQSVPAAPPSGFSAPLEQQSYEPGRNAAIVPAPSANNGPSLIFDWQPVEIDSNRSCSCLVSTTSDHALSVRVEQPPYDRTFRGTGAVKVAVIPVAGIGAKGRLVAQDDVSGEAAEFTWEWKPIGAAKWVNPSKAAAKTATAVKSKQAEALAGKSARAKAAAGPAAQSTFFGVQATGHRFAFILDISGSMSGKRWEASKTQLAAALHGLSEESEIFVVLFSSGILQPPGQDGWKAADADWTNTVLEWVSATSPDGGTYPQPAFDLVFSLPERADVVYFMTDGVFSAPSPADLAKLCASEPPKTGLFGKLGRALFHAEKSDAAFATNINTITLDDESGAAICKQIAEGTGGTYTHASSSAPPQTPGTSPPAV